MGRQSRERTKRRLANAANTASAAPSYGTFKTSVDRNKLAPAGISGDLVIVARAKEQNDEPLLNDSSQRPFSVWCTFSRGHQFPADFSFDGPKTGESFFKFADNVVDAKIFAGGLWFSLHANMKNEIAGASSELTGTSAREVRSRFLAALSPALDHWSYLGNTPLVIRTVTCEDRKNAISTVSFTTPYADLTLNPGTGELRAELLPIYGLYREAKNASSPFYRFLCYFKILEAVYGHLRPAVFALARKEAIPLVRQKEEVPDHPELRLFWSSYIGRPIKSLMDKELEPEYRNAAAHFLSEDGRPLNPSDSEAVTKFSNMLLIGELCARVVIDQQADYYRQIDEELRRRGAAVAQPGVAAGGAAPRS
jgi:hypothetical protein